MTTPAYRVAWLATNAATVEQREDHLSEAEALARVETLRAEGRPVAGGAPYRIDLEETT